MRANLGIVHLLIFCLSLLMGTSAFAAVCSAPGAAGLPLNAYYQGQSANAGSTTVVIGPVRSSSIEISTTDTSAIESGDTLLIIQMQDADINNTNTDAYGDGTSGDNDGSGYTALNSSGLYEFVAVDEIVGSTITLSDPLVHTYHSGAATTSTARKTFQVIRVPRFFNYTMAGSGTVTEWNGRTGGVYVVDVVNTLQIDGATIDASEAGFRGGGSGIINPITNGVGEDSYASADAASGNGHLGAYKGEGIAGTPEEVGGGTISGGFNGQSANLTSSDQGFAGDLGYPNAFTRSRGGPGNAGGGGDEHNAGGAGGSNYGFGGEGGSSFGRYFNNSTSSSNCTEFTAETGPGTNDGFYGCDGDGSRPVGGDAGAPLTKSTVPDYESRLFMGGGGGAGSNNNAGDNGSIAQSSGGDGGGIIFIRTANLIQGSGSLALTSNGSDGGDTGRDGAGGGGAGGSILVLADTGSYPFVTVQADGGQGGITGEPLRGGETQGPGGGGGGGAALIASGVSVGSLSTAGGAAGTNEPATGIFNPIGAGVGDGNSVEVDYDPDLIDLSGACGEDFGDAPTISGYPDASHFLIREIFIGSSVADEELATLSDDNSTGSADEDGLLSLPTLVTSDSTYSVDVDVSNSMGLTGTLFGWVDFDGDGSFDNVTEAATFSVPTGSANLTATLTWIGISPVAGSTYLRLRLTADSTITTSTPNGLAESGEVEDHPLTIYTAGSACTYPTADARYNLDGSFVDSSAASPAHDPSGGDNTLVSGDYSSDIYVSGSSAPYFDGSDLVQLDDAGTTSFLNDAFDQMSVIFWMRPDGFTGDQVIWDEGGSGNGVAIRLSGTTLEAALRDTAQFDLSAPFPQDGGWHHVGLTFNSSGTSATETLATLFIDGIAVDTVSWTTADVTDLQLGAHGNGHGFGQNNSSNAFNDNGIAYSGYLDQLVYWTDGAAGDVSGNADISADMATLAACDTPVLRRDYGDAPDTGAGVGTGNYESTNDNLGPNHLLSADLFLGDIAGDDDVDSDQNTEADGDDTEGAQLFNDEGAEQLLSSGLTISPIITTDTTYQMVIDVTNTTGAVANLYAWIDFDFSGTFDDSELATVASGTIADSQTTATLDWTLPALTLGDTYIRLRLTTDTLTDSEAGFDGRSLGNAGDGEVEDYLISIILPPDFSDGPTIYGDAWHALSGTVDLYLGIIDGDGEDAAVDGGDAGEGADGDDTDGTADEDGLSTVPDLNVEDASYTLPVDVINTGASAELAGWIDFDIDGTFDEDEFATATVTASGVVNLVWSDIGSTGPDIDNGDTYVRLRLTRDADIVSGVAATSSATGGADDGEVEDHLIHIYTADYGDAPESYGDTMHRVLSAPVLYLGSGVPDEENTTLLGVDLGVGADGDDTTDTDDENSVVSFPSLSDDATVGSTYTVSVDVVNAGISANLVGWIDFNNDGDFDVLTEASDSVVAVTSTSTVDLDFTIPADLANGTTYARFRLTTDPITTVNSSGSSLDGEVEDFSFGINDSTNLYLEAECGIIGNEWTAVSNTQASEQTYLESVSSRGGTLSGTQPLTDLIQYDFPLPGTATYDVYVRANFASTNDNSFSISLNNNSWILLNTFTTSGSWLWLNTGQQITGTVGDPISMYISYREDGSLIDKFAIIPTGNSAPTGMGDDVGGCFDFGDAPDSSASNATGDYSTNLSNFGAYHAVDGEGSIYLGTQAPDTESDALQNATATGDDSADETEADLMASNGGVLPIASATDTTYSLTVDLFNDKGVDAFLFAWVDWDNDGLFEEGELADSAPFTIATNVAGQTQAISWTSLSLSVGNYPMRLRVTTDTEVTEGSDGGEDEASVNVAIDGEVEDHFITVGDYDFSDGPSDYSSVSHFESTDITLGSLIDFETAAFTSTDADGDDGDGIDDEDGVTQFLNIVTEAEYYTVELSCNDHDGTSEAGAIVYGWIDFDGDNSLGNDSSEFASAACSDPDNTTEGTATLLFAGFNSLFAGGNDDVLARFRITTDTLTTTDAATDASDGEVEDYIASIIDQSNFGSCPTAGFLIQDTNPDLYSIDIAGGLSSLLENNMVYEDGSSASSTNSWGYNEFDGYIYGVIQGTDRTLLRIGEGAGGVYGITRFGPLLDLPNFSPTWGDVDDNGVLHLGRSGQSALHRVDVNPGSPTYLTHLGTVTIDSSSGLPGDMSFNPLDGLMYGLSGGGDIVQLNTVTGVRTDVANFGSVSGFGGETIANAGAGFFDAAGFFYGSINATGSVYRFDLRDPTAVTAAAGTGDLADYVDYFGQPTGATSVNDGARCPSAEIRIDYGDAPTAAQSGFSANYPTLLDDDGARHDITDSNTLYLGSVAGDNEFNGQPTLAADGDDATGDADEDGISFLTTLNEGDNATIAVTASGAGTLNAWVDFNLDGDWADTGEQIFTDQAVVAGVNTFSITLPANISTGTSYTRFRLSSDTGLLPTGPASDGEVEDLQVELVRVFNVQGFVFNDLNSDGVLDSAEEGIDGVEVVLESSGGSCIAVSTDATGLYSFEDVGTDTYRIYEADGVDTPIPASCPPTEADPSGYLSSTDNSITGVVVSTASVTGQNFGDVQRPEFTPNNEGVIFPASVIYYPHIFASTAEGSATFSITESGEPAPTNWETNLFIDADCSGGFGAGDTLLSGAQALASNAELCLLVQVVSPFEADATDIHIATVTAIFDYPGTVVPTQTITVVDTTTVLSEGDGQLKLTKLVENLSCQAGGANFPCDYDGGSQSADNNARPGDIVRYSIGIQNIGTEPISNVEIYDVVPSYTALFDPDDIGEPNGTQPLDVSCGYPNTRGSDFTYAATLTGCTLIAPSATPAYTDVGDDDVADNPATENAPGYSGGLQWLLNGDLGAGESATIVFDVKVE